MFRNDFSGPFQKKLIAHALNGRAGGSEYGGHIILSDDILTELISREIQYPMLFKVQVDGTKRSVYCGVTEFTAPKGTVYLPDWMMAQLEIRPGAEISLFNVMLQLGQYLLIRPHTYKFVQTYSDPKTILEQHIVKYPTLTKGTTIKINVDGEAWSFDIVDLKPARAVCILNTDLRLDFDEPVDIKEYEAKLKDDAEQRKINRQFAETASEFQHMATPSSTDLTAHDHQIGSPVGYESHTPLDFGAQTWGPGTAGSDDGVNIFAQNSDEEEGNIPLSKRFGGGNSIKRNGAPTSSHPISPIQTKQNNTTSSTRPITNNINTVFAPSASTLTTTTTNPVGGADSEADRKKQRAELARQQRAALFGKAVGKPITANTPGPTDAINTTKSAVLLGTNKDQQGVIALNTEKVVETGKTTTVKDGDWLLYYDEKGRLVKREDMRNSFATSISRGVGNSIKKD